MKGTTDSLCGKCNTTKEERLAPQDQRTNPDRIIVPADKGNVILDTEYHNKLISLLTTDTYKTLPRNTTPTVEGHTIEVLNEVKWEDNLVKRLHPYDSQLARVYGFRKIHKPNAPWPPVVGAIGSPTYRLAKHLRTLLKPHVENSYYHIRNFILNISSAP